MEEKEMSLRALKCIFVKQLLDQHSDPDEGIFHRDNETNAEFLLTVLSCIDSRKKNQQILRDYIKRIGGEENLVGWEIHSLADYRIEDFVEDDEEDEE